ncbi:CGNR zinc finger domain-containing protein [Nocardia camponoti]|uniref:Zinc finger CGNR domain-containing protein n=1 Tax=Nocardia camponoti TaxID=1616106 RepID=A0A917V5R4_9NOCA|nr:CGNR zinc finger domain-containing protein [Nocardia camponoti]GGK41763.1 hypothetical protein GCM10011591_11500 [Nocardia camponoti]
MTTPTDPRPHTGEPLAIDLLNTRWQGDSPGDLLSDLAGVRRWLELTGVADEVPADDHTSEALLSAREAIHTAVTSGDATALNQLLDLGRIRRTLAANGPHDIPEVADPANLPGWLAANNLLDLLNAAPNRIRQCAHPNCVLFFYDTSKNGTRRWHSMATCGNRAKAARHYAAQQSSSSSR